MTVSIVPLRMAAEIRAGDDLAALLLGCGEVLVDGDVVCVTHKAIAKAEGRIARLGEIEPSHYARTIAGEHGDPRHIELVLRESTRIVRQRRALVIAETRQGMVCANAGLDRSNTAGHDEVVLLPLDPDASAAGLRAALEERTGRRLAVVIADTVGRAWRVGIVGTAIGAAGIAPVRDYAGTVDPNGYLLRATTVAIADEVAAAADLVFGKVERVPAAIVRGVDLGDGEGGASDLIREPGGDLFR